MPIKDLLNKLQLNIPESTFTEKELYSIFTQELILSKTTQENLYSILLSIISRRNLLLIGNAGIGKNALIYYINAKRGIPTIRFSFNQDTLIEDLIGSYKMEGKKFIWQDGPIITAMKKGYIFIADEMNLALSQVLRRFISVWYKRQIILFEKNNETIIAKPTFLFIATQNPSQGFEGRKELHPSIAKLFTNLNLSAYSVKEVSQITQGLYSKESNTYIKVLIEIQQAIEKFIKLPHISQELLENYHFNLRTIKRLLNRFQHIKNNRDVQFIYLLFSFFLNTFPNDYTEYILTILADQLQKSLLKNANQYNISYLQTLLIEYQEQISPILQEATQVIHIIEENTLDPFPITTRRLQYLEQIHQAIIYNENLLLEGPHHSRIKELIETYAHLNNQSLCYVTLAKGTHTSDIIGSLKPNDAGIIAWRNGPLIEGLLKERWIVLENIEVASSDLIEKLNMLLDDANSILLPPEAGENQLVHKKGNARIIAIKNIKTSVTENTISRAFRNRFSSIYINQPLNDHQDLEESLYLLHLHIQNKPSDKSIIPLIQNMITLQHIVSEMIETQDLASDLELEKPILLEEHLLRWFMYITHNIDFKRPLDKIILEGLHIHYILNFSKETDRKAILDIWQKLKENIPIKELLQSLQKEKTSKKKSLTKQSKFNKKRNWDPQKHYRDAIEKAKQGSSKQKLKKGIKINTPETGGNTKTGPDAWYGRNTVGNKGRGEAGSGGGVWGYKTQEILNAFLEKYNPIGDYQMNMEWTEFQKEFSPIFNKLLYQFEQKFNKESEMQIYNSYTGHKIDSRQYMSYMATQKDVKIFSKTNIIQRYPNFKDIEFIFLLNKGRRIFNFDLTIACIVAIQGILEVFYKNKISFRLYGYSDLQRTYMNTIDLIPYIQYNSQKGVSVSMYQKKQAFSEIVHNWYGDMVYEFVVLDRVLTESIKTSAKHKVIFMFSDFRGVKAKQDIEEEVTSIENIKLKQYIQEHGKQGDKIVGVQLGNRVLAPHLFQKSIQINSENFYQAPQVLYDAIILMINNILNKKSFI